MADASSNTPSPIAFGRRRFRFGLRTLLIAVTIVAVIAWQAIRITGLLRQARNHESAASELRGESFSITKVQPVDPQFADDLRALADQAFAHRYLAEQCRRAIWKPWVASVPDLPAGITAWEIVQMTD